MVSDLECTNEHITFLVESDTDPDKLLSYIATASRNSVFEQTPMLDTVIQWHPSACIRVYEVELEGTFLSFLQAEVS